MAQLDFKVPRDQVKDDTAQTEFGIVVGYESNNPNNLKVYIPSRGYSLTLVGKCLFYKLRQGLITIICLHVDDLLIVSQSNQEVQFVKKRLSNAYWKVEVNDSNISYLGMEITSFPDHSIEVTQRGYVEKIINSTEFKASYSLDQCIFRDM